MIRQTELWNSVFQHPAETVNRFEHGHVVAAFGHIAGKSESGRTGADNSYLYGGEI